MSDPRMIPAGDARVTIEAAGHVSSDGHSWPDNYVRGLAHTVVEQAARIEQLDAELDAVASRSLAQGRKLRRHEIPLGRVQKVADLLDQMAGYNGRLADSLSSEYAKGKHDAYAKAAEIIRDALGDTDE